MGTTVESMYPHDLIHAVGHVVMSAAWLEDKAGELVQLNAILNGNGRDAPARGWAASGKQLVEALKPIAPTGIAERLTLALERRNEVVHGVFLSGSVLTEASDQAWPWASMKRALGSSDPAGYNFFGWSVADLHALAEELSALESVIDDEISYAMGLKVRPPASP